MPRGCGERQDGGLYACVGLGEGGTPIERFMIDPARAWDMGPMRGPMLASRTVELGLGNSMLVKDMLMWVGAEFYPTVSDFIEEARIMGVSKRIPANFPIEQLTAGWSRLVLIHPRAILVNSRIGPTVTHYAKQWCVHRKGPETWLPHHGPDKQDTCCVYDLWGLEAGYQHPKRVVSEPYSKTIQVPAGCPACDGSGEDRISGTCKLCEGSGMTLQTTARYQAVDVTIPCGRQYTVECLTGFPEGTEHEYRPGVFAVFPLTHMEFCAKRTDPTEQLERFAETDWDFRVVEE